MRHGRGGACLRAPDFQRHHVLAGRSGLQSQIAEARPVIQTVDQKRDHPGGRMGQRVLHVVQHGQIGLIPGRGEQRQPRPQHRQPPGHGVEQRAGMGEDRHAARRLPLRMRGVEADRERMVRVIDAVAVGTDDPDTLLRRDPLQFALAFRPARIQALCIPRRPDNHRFQPRARAVADGLHGGLGGDGEEGGVQRFRHGGQVGEAGNAVHRGQAPADPIDPAGKARVADVGQHDVAVLGGVVRGPDHRDRARMKQGVQRVPGGHGGRHVSGAPDARLGGMVPGCMGRCPLPGRDCTPGANLGLGCLSHLANRAHTPDQ